MRNFQLARDAFEAGNREEAAEILEEVLLYNPDHIEALELRAEMAITPEGYEEAQQRLREAQRKAAPNIAVHERAPTTLIDVSPVVRNYLAAALLTVFVYVFGSALAGLAVNAYFLDQASRDRKSGIQVEYYGCLQWLLFAGVIFLAALLLFILVQISQRY